MDKIWYNGHELWPGGIAADIFLALVPILPLLLFILFLKKKGVVKYIGSSLFGVIWLLLMPNTWYLAFEWRHLLFPENHNLFSLGLYSGLMVLGMTTFEINVILAAYHLPYLKRWPVIGIAIWTLAASCGVAIGLSDINTIDLMLYPDTTWRILSLFTQLETWLTLSWLIPFTFTFTLITAKLVRRPRSSTSLLAESGSR